MRLLRAHDRMPDSSSTIELGRAAAELIRDKIDALKAPAGARREQQLPHLVLRTCFVDGAKLFQAAGRLGLSERQLSRERARAIGLLRAELESALVTQSYRPEPVPAIVGFLQRPSQTRALKAALEENRHVEVSGAPGIGKTSLVAALAAEARLSSSVYWYRFRPGINDSLNSVLFDLGEYVAGESIFELANYMNQALPAPDSALGTRLALRALDGRPRLLVFDDCHAVEDQVPVLGFLEELATRLPMLRVVTIGRHRRAGPGESGVVEIAPLSRSETADLLTRLRVSCSAQMTRKLHAWTHGNPHLVKLAASWLKTASDDEVARGVDSLNDRLEVQTFLLSNVTGLLDGDDRALLEAASVFRDRFSDDALAFVAQRTRGAVIDAGMRLVRSYVATRSLDGEGAFFHASVREYVYARLEPERRTDLHARAAAWYERSHDEREALHHRRAAGR
jgi:ATP/maltotriose-dependent transcriptional regulator MalT